MPRTRFVSGHFDEYQWLGDRVIAVFDAFTPLVERVSIDEAFLDVAGARQLFGTPTDIAVAIRRRVRDEIGLPVSVGVARTKHLAKVASQVAKPDGVIVVDPEGEGEFLHDLPVALMWGVGPVTQASLAGAGIGTIGELAAAPTGLLDRLLGRAVGTKLASLAVNVDARPIEKRRRAASMGAQAALGRRVATLRLVRSTLGYLADRVAGRLRSASRAGHTVTVRVRFTGLRSVTRSATLPVAISATLTLTELATELAQAALTDHPREREITLLGLSVSNLVLEPGLQLELPLDVDHSVHRPGTARGAARWSTDQAVDAVRARFGSHAVGYATAILSDVDRVPEAFRELAERRDDDGAGQG